MYGADTANYNQAQTQFGLDQDAARAAAMGLKTPDEIFAETYNAEIQNGAKDKEARRRALTAAQMYRPTWEKNTLAAAYNYGVNNNALNDTALELLTRIAAYNPNAAAMALKTHGVPLDLFNLDVWNEKTGRTNALQREMAALQHGYGMEDRQLAANIARGAMEDKYRLQGQYAKDDIGRKLMLAQGQADIALDTEKRKMEILEEAKRQNSEKNLDGFRQMYNELTGNGIEPETAAKIAATLTGVTLNWPSGNGGKSGNGAGSNSPSGENSSGNKPTPADKRDSDNYSLLIKRYRNYISTGSEADYDSFAKFAKEYKEKYDPHDKYTNDINRLLYAADLMRELKLIYDNGTDVKTNKEGTKNAADYIRALVGAGLTKEDFIDILGYTPADYDKIQDLMVLHDIA